ncbi:MAG: N-acetylmuramoyl-L-alanine amidase [Flavobacteriales bacterium]|jgi:N-acetylmuramoyl-L-alanine amidase
MKAIDIQAHENRFFQSHLDSDGKQFILSDQSIDIKNSTDKMHYIKCRRENDDRSFYYASKFAKSQIVLHHTAGYLKGDIAALTKPSNHVSVPFIVARNGKILSLWTSSSWSYHLGRGAAGGNAVGSKKTIAIELSNIGYLKKIGDNLVTPYSDTDVYCNITETQFYTKLATPYRGYNYFATFTDEQYESLIILLRYLTSRYDIPKTLVDENKRYERLSAYEIANFKGILSHVNFRKSGKWDLGPAFHWKRVID